MVWIFGIWAIFWVSEMWKTDYYIFACFKIIFYQQFWNIFEFISDIIFKSTANTATQKIFHVAICPSWKPILRLGVGTISLRPGKFVLSSCNNTPNTRLGKGCARQLCRTVVATFWSTEWGQECSERWILLFITLRLHNGYGKQASFEVQKRIGVDSVGGSEENCGKPGKGTTHCK